METSSQPAWGTYRPRGWSRLWLAATHAIPAWPALRRPALWWRKPLKRAWRDWVDVQVWGLRLRLCPQGNLSEQRWLLTPQFLDPIERQVLAAELRDGDIFFDIGANAGVYSFWVASRGRSVRVEAFEPDPELCARFRANLQRNNLTQVTLHELALGASPGELQLVRGTSNRGQNKLASTVQDHAITVTVESLPGLMGRANIPRIDLLKIDVEGHEVPVLEPFFQAYPPACWPRLVITELERGVRSLEDCPHGRLLARHGYRISRRCRMNAICQRVADQP